MKDFIEFLEEGNATVKLMNNDRNKELQKVVKVLKRIKWPKTVYIKINNMDEFFQVYVSDPNYRTPSRGVAANIGISGQEHEEYIKFKQVTAKLVYDALKKSKIELDDIWIEKTKSGDSTGGVLLNY